MRFGCRLRTALDGLDLTGPVSCCKQEQEIARVKGTVGALLENLGLARPPIGFRRTCRGTSFGTMANQRCLSGLNQCTVLKIKSFSPHLAQTVRKPMRNGSQKLSAWVHSDYGCICRRASSVSSNHRKGSKEDYPTPLRV